MRHAFGPITLRRLLPALLIAFVTLPAQAGDQPRLPTVDLSAMLAAPASAPVLEGGESRVSATVAGTIELLD